MRGLLPIAIIIGLMACGDASSSADKGAAPAPSGSAAPAAASAATPGTPIASSTVVATWAGGQLTYGEMLAEQKSALARLEIEYLQNRYQTEQGGLIPWTPADIEDALSNLTEGHWDYVQASGDVLQSFW